MMALLALDVQKKYFQTTVRFGPFLKYSPGHVTFAQELRAALLQGSVEN
jgi:hypothetical protein